MGLVRKPHGGVPGSSARTLVRILVIAVFHYECEPVTFDNVQKQKSMTPQRGGP